MENQLSKYLGRNLKDAITNVEVVQGTAKDSGNIYFAIEISFINGYQKRLFLKSDEQFAWTNAFEMLDIDKAVEKAF